jgi:glycosyltransferase involved in cell wall biosynthesis
MDNLVTAIITTHNREPEILKRAIDSVLSQTYRNIELIVVDDSPSYTYHDEIVKLVKSYDREIKYLVNDAHPGACGSRNIGIQHASGKLIALLDDDDEWVAEKLSWMVSCILGNVGLVYGKYRIIKNKGATIKNESHFEGDVYEQLLKNGNFIGGCSVPVFRKDIAVNVGLFDENLKSAQDYDFWLRIAQKYEVSFVDKCVVNYYLSSDAISTSANKKIKSSEYLLEKYHSDFEKYPEAKTRVYREMIYRLVCAGQYKQSYNKYKHCKDSLSVFDYVKVLIKGTIKHAVLLLHLQDR